MASTGNYIGNYKIVDQLSSDAVNFVYLAEHISSPGRPVVLKVFTTPLNSAEESNAFLQEAYSLVKLRHASILPIYDSGIAAGYPFLVTEYLFPPVTLRDRINRQSPNPLPQQEALAICEQIGQALAYAHQQEIIHRQIKPEHILYTASGLALLADFGLASVRIQQDNQGVADPYLAPEQLQGTISRSKLSDQYALGCVAYELFTGHQPSPDPIPPTQLNPSLPISIEQAILKAMARKLTDRHANVKAFVAALLAPAGTEAPATPIEAPTLIAETPTLFAPAAISGPFDAPTYAEPAPQPIAPGTAPEMGAVALASTGVLPPVTENGVETPAYAPIGVTPIPPYAPVGVAQTPISESGAAIIGSSPPINRRKRPSRRMLTFALIALAVLLVVGSLPFLVPYLLSILPASAATVTVTPASKHMDNTYTIMAVTGTPDATQNQVQARIVSYTTPKKSMTVNATGQGSEGVTEATGTLIFSNSTGYFTIFAQTFSDNSGVGLTIDSAINIGPGQTVAVFAHAAKPGSIGNVPANDINATFTVGAFLGTIHIQNTNPFTGGTDRNFSTVQQSDIDSATTTLQSDLTYAAQTGLQSLIHANEQTVQDAQCTPKITPNHQANDRAANVTVQGSVTCTVEVYVPQDMKALASQLLGTDASSQLGANYALIGDTVTGPPTFTSLASDNSTASFTVEAQGVWVYQFSNAQKQSLAQSIAGKTQADSKTLLLKQQGITKVSINTSGLWNALPSSAGDIKFVIVTVAGLHA